jgi:hypothetical protein
MSEPIEGAPCRRRARRRAPLHGLLLVAALAVAAAAHAHVPVFPDGDAPVEVESPTVSKAYYRRLAAGAAHVYVVPPVPRAIPLQLLVLDDATGARLRHEVTVAGPGAESRSLERLDVAYHEPFSGLGHRIRARGALGPSEAGCRVTVRQTGGPPGPYTLSIGDEERFGLGDVLGLVGLGDRLERWRTGAR